MQQGVLRSARWQGLCGVLTGDLQGGERHWELQRMPGIKLLGGHSSNCFDNLPEVSIRHGLGTREHLGQQLFACLPTGPIRDELDALPTV